MIRILALILSCLLWTNAAQGADSFIVSDIRVDGLQRISEGTIYSYLPLNPGDELNYDFELLISPLSTLCERLSP